MLTRSFVCLGILGALALGACSNDSKSKDNGTDDSADDTGGGGSGGGGSGGSAGKGGSGGGGSGGSAGSGGSGGTAGSGGSGGTAGSGGSGGTGGAKDGGAPDTAAADASAGDTKVADTGVTGDGAKGTMSFFITSVGTGTLGGNLGGLTGADKKCQMLAETAGYGAKTWHAYLSVSAADAQAAVNARDRIGKGPWYNVKGTMIAASVAALHDPDMNKISVANGLDEKGGSVPTNEHDIMTGSMADGTAYPASAKATCANWTSKGTDVGGRVGHFNRSGGGQAPSSFNSAHTTPNCTPDVIKSVAGAARTYCFAID